MKRPEQQAYLRSSPIIEPGELPGFFISPNSRGEATDATPAELDGAVMLGAVYVLVSNRYNNGPKPGTITLHTEPAPPDRPSPVARVLMDAHRAVAELASDTATPESGIGLLKAQVMERLANEQSIHGPEHPHLLGVFAVHQYPEEEEPRPQLWIPDPTVRSVSATIELARARVQAWKSCRVMPPDYMPIYHAIPPSQEARASMAYGLARTILSDHLPASQQHTEEAAPVFGAEPVPSRHASLDHTYALATVE